MKTTRRLIITALALGFVAAYDQTLEGQTLRITKDSIGGLKMWSPLRLLWSRSSRAYKTVQYGYESAHPAIAFPLPGGTAIAYQDLDSLDVDRLPDGWFIRGANALLPDSVPLTATWAQLRARYGTFVANFGEEATVTVMFCRLPLFFFTLDVHLEDTGQVDPSLIPATTKVEELLILRDRLAGWSCDKR